MRKNTKRLIALLMTITMILAVCPVEIFAAGDDTAVSTVVAEQTEGDNALAEASDSEPVLESGKSDSDEAEEPVSNNQSEEVSEQSGAEFVLEKNDTVLPAPTLQRFNRSNVAKRYVITAVFEGEGTEQSPYLIQSADDWDTLANHINSGGTDYNGKYFKLTDDITVTTVLGIRPGSSDSADRPFVGTFNGAGHTLTVNYNKSGFVAPFAIAHNSTIENLKVKGTVKSTDNHASGLVGASKDVRLGDASYLNIKNVTISTDISCNSHVAGVIGHAHSATITMENVVFDGSLNASSVQGGFIGWGGANQGRLFNCTLKDCMFAGTYKSGVAFNSVAYASGQGNVVLTNDFYTTKSASGGSPITPTGSGTVKLVAATVEKDGQVNYFDNIATAASSENWVAGSTLKLMSDVTTASTITVPSGEHTLDLNGYGILITGNSRVITINKDASLKLNDSNPDRIHYITLTDYRGTAVSDSGESSVSNGNGIIQVKGGYLTGGYLNNTGSHDKCGAGVFNWGTFVMNGGNIVGNTMLNNSGAGIRNSGFFTMNSGKIAFNKATANGGGVTTYVPGGSQGKMTMNAGEISDNYCGKYGGGIQLAGPLELTGGAIVRNTADMGGSGIYYSGKGDRFKISGEPIIKDNLNDNLFLDTDATFMISGSLAEDAEIGILMKNNAVFTVGWKDNMGAADPSECFTSDNSNYAVILNSSGEAEIGVPPAARIISGEVTTNYGSISDAVGAWTAGSTLKLLSDVTTGSTINVPSGEHTLDLNGHTLKAGSAGYSVITVGSGAELVIDDTAGGGKITGGSVGQNYGGGITVDASTLTLRGGAISGNANTYGAIGYCSGGVLVKNSGKFYMEGGEISDNTSYVGGGVCCDTSATTVIITGGEIKNNTITRFGSGVLAGRSSSAIFRIGGDAKITDNISTWTSDKDGEASVNFSKLSISGNPTVRGCWKTSGNSSANTHINLDNEGSSVQRIALDGALTNETGTPQILLSPIYRWTDLQNGKTFVFTSNWSTYMGTANPADYFGVDASVSGVRIIRKDGEAAFTGSGDLGDLYITYDANGGTGEMDAQLVSTTSAVLNQNSFTNGEKEFIGWNTKADGSGTPYSDKGDITLSGDVTLYAQWAEKHAHDDIDFKIWTSTTSLPTKAGDYYLGADVTISSTWNVPSGTVNLCLDSHGIKMVGSGSVINVGSSAVLNVYDCGEIEHKFVVDSPASNGAGLAVVDDTLTSGYKTFTGGYITGGNAQDGAGVYVTGGGKFNMYGGTILGNLSSRHGGGVNVSMSSDGSEFNLYGGCVCYNSAVWGGGINIFATARVSGESLIENNVASNGGGGIELESGGRLYMNGGTVTENRVLAQNGGMWKAGGIHVPNGTEYHLQGAVRVINNYEGASGTTQNNVFVRKEVPGKVILDGALAADASIGAGTNGAAPFTLTSAYKTYMGDADQTKYFVSDNTDYTVIRKDGEAALEYPPVPDVSASDYTGDYDGAAHGIAVSVPTGAAVQYGTEEGDYSLTENPSFTDAGIYTVYYKVTMDKHTPVEGSAVVTINKINATVTITAHNITADYDGKAHSADGFDFAADTTLYTAADFTFSGRAEAVRTDAGKTEMGLSAEQFSNTNENFACVTFNVTDGFVKIDPIDVTVTIMGNNTTVEYDGKAHSEEGYDFEADSSLYNEDDFTFSGNAEAQRTDAGKTEMGLSAEQFSNTNANFASVTFNVTDGFVKIDPIDVIVTITGNNTTADYDGKAHSVDGYDFAADNELYTEADFTFGGNAEAQRTDAGKTEMGLSAEQFSNTNANFSTVTFNVTDGFVKIDPIDVTVTIMGNNTTVEYDGKAHSVDGYDFAADNELYTEADFTFNGRAEALGTNAGTYKMGLSAEQFENTNQNFATVVFDVTDGYLTVNPIDVTVTITGNNTTADYDGKAHSAEGYEFAADSELYTEADFTFSGNAAAERTDAGTIEMGLAPAQFENTNKNFAAVTFNVTDGFVKINQINAVVTITGHTATNPYDGKAHTVSGYDAESSTALYDADKDFEFSGSANATQTNAGTAKMGLAPEQFKNTNKNFATVTFKLTDGYQTITRVDAQITKEPRAKDELVYTGDTQALIVSGIAVGGKLYYATGTDDKSVPANAKFKQTLPAAKDIGNYYIWYKVAADDNHNSLAPKCFKVTLAAKDWVSINGKILDNDKTPLSGAEVILMRGNNVVDTITSYENGEYYFTVPKGVYNLVVKVNGITVTNIADVTGDVSKDIIMSAPNTDSVLDIVSSDKSIAVGGLEEEASFIRKNESVPDEVNVSVKMTVQAIAESETDSSKAITDFAKDKYIEFYDLKVEKTVGTVTTNMDKTQTVLEIAIPCSFTSKREIEVFSCDGSEVKTLSMSDSGEPGTYRVDAQNGLIFIYTNSINTVALAYQPYFSVKSILTLGTFEGNVSVKLEKESGDKVFELSDVSMQDISFKGVPRGTYTLTVKWVDGVENTIELPFNIK